MAKGVGQAAKASARFGIWGLAVFAVVCVGIVAYQVFKSSDKQPSPSPVGAQGGGRGKEKKQKNERKLAQPHKVETSRSSTLNDEKNGLSPSTTSSGATTNRDHPASGVLRNRCGRTNAPKEDPSEPTVKQSDKTDNKNNPDESSFSVHAEPRILLSPSAKTNKVVVDSENEQRDATTLTPELLTESKVLTSPSPHLNDIPVEEPSKTVSPPEAVSEPPIPEQKEVKVDSGPPTPRPVSPVSPELNGIELKTSSSSPPRIMGIQLPTPTPSDTDSDAGIIIPPSSSPESHPDLLEWTPDLRSFPPTELISPTSPSSPLSDSFTFPSLSSDGEGVYSFPSSPRSDLSSTSTSDADSDSDSDSSFRGFGSSILPRAEEHQRENTLLTLEALITGTGTGNFTVGMEGRTTAQHRSTEEGRVLFNDRDSDSSSDESWSELGSPPWSPSPHLNGGPGPCASLRH